MHDAAMKSTLSLIGSSMFASTFTPLFSPTNPTIVPPSIQIIMPKSCSEATLIQTNRSERVMRQREDCLRHVRVVMRYAGEMHDDRVD